jgi:hypothetical protein
MMFPEAGIKDLDSGLNVRVFVIYSEKQSVGVWRVVAQQ